jgi:hypothetical protein
MDFSRNLKNAPKKITKMKLQKKEVQFSEIVRRLMIATNKNSQDWGFLFT